MVSKPTRVAVILPSLGAGGVERVTLTYLRLLPKEHFSVDLIVLQASDALLDFVPEWVRIHYLGSRRTLTAMVALARKLRQLAPDVVYTGHARTATTLALIRPALPSFKHLARLQSTPTLERKYGAYSRARMWAYAYGYHRADRVAAETHEMKESAKSAFGLSSRDMIVMENPVDLSFIRANTKAGPSPFDGSHANILAAGRLGFEKGFDVLIESLPAIVESNQNAMLHIVGKDVGEYTTLKKLVDRLNLSERVRFWGHQENPYRFFAHCDAFVLSSRWEGSPNVLIENYCLNTPLVATRFSPSVDRLISEGKNGYTCSVEDAEGLAKAVIKALALSRGDIDNPAYIGSRLDGVITDLLAE